MSRPAPAALKYGLLGATFLALSAFAQSSDPAAVSPPVAAVSPDPAKAVPSDPVSKSTAIQPDPADPMVVRAQQNLDRVSGLVKQGIVPPSEQSRAQDELNDALDLSILRYSALASDLLPEQADQTVAVAERMFLRRQRRAIQDRQLVASGIMARSEAENSSAEVISAKMQLDLAIERARLVKDLALQKSLAEVESEAENHPELDGKLYTHYSGNGVFTRAEFQRLSSAYLSTFGHVIPVSADGQTAVHRAMGFDHTGRIDIALSPDQPEGAWLLRYLQRNHIPYYAFRTAVAHKATGAHIHLGPGSTRIAEMKACCGS